MQGVRNPLPMMSAIRSKIAVRLKNLGVRYVAPTHCTGGEAREVFAAVYGKGFIDSGAGRVIGAADLKSDFKTKDRAADKGAA